MGVECDGIDKSPVMEAELSLHEVAEAFLGDA